jgi:hypothetical protein
MLLIYPKSSLTRPDTVTPAQAGIHLLRHSGAGRQAKSQNPSILHSLLNSK